MDGLSFSRELDEDDFNMFYHLEQIDEALLLNSISARGNRIIFPNLRIIRGRQLANGRAISLLNVSVAEFILPKLTEVSLGDVRIGGIQGDDERLCNVLRVNWPDILDGGTFMDTTCPMPSQSGIVT